MGGDNGAAYTQSDAHVAAAVVSGFLAVQQSGEETVKLVGQKDNWVLNQNTVLELTLPKEWQEGDKQYIVRPKDILIKANAPQVQEQENNEQSQQ